MLNLRKISSLKRSLSIFSYSNYSKFLKVNKNNFGRKEFQEKKHKETENFYKKATDTYETIINFEENNLKKSAFNLNGEKIEVRANNIADLLNEGNKEYTIFTSKSKFQRVLLAKILLVGFSVYGYYYLYKNCNMKSLMTCGFYLINTFFLLNLINFHRLKATRYIKKVTLASDLKSVKFSIYGRRSIIVKNENIILSREYNPKVALNVEGGKRTFLNVELNKNNYILPLTSAEIPNLDLFSIVIKGYDLKLE